MYYDQSASLYDQLFYSAEYHSTGLQCNLQGFLTDETFIITSFLSRSPTLQRVILEKTTLYGALLKTELNPKATMIGPHQYLLDKYSEYQMLIGSSDPAGQGKTLGARAMDVDSVIGDLRRHEKLRTEAFEELNKPGLTD